MMISRPDVSGKAGFTLVEIILVVAIIIIATAIGTPSFIRSYRSAKIKTSVRTIVMASRYARSMAVLHQKEIAIFYDLELGSVQIVELTPNASLGDRNRFLDQRTERFKSGGENTEDQEDANASYNVSSLLVRNMAEDVDIRSVENEIELKEYDGIIWINYHPNGTSDGCIVTLVDTFGTTATIEIDALSGKSKVEFSD